MNFKRTLVLISLAFVLTLTGCMTSILPLEKPFSATSTDGPVETVATDGAVTHMPSQNTRPGELSGGRVYYSGEGSILTFETVNEYEFR